MHHCFVPAVILGATFLVQPAVLRAADPQPPKDQPAAAAPAKIAPAPGPAAAPAKPAATAGDQPAAAAKPLAPETVLVEVDGRKITQGDLDQETKTVEKMMRQRGLSTEQLQAMFSAFKPRILDGLVIQALIENECQARKISVAPADIKKELAAIRDSLPEKMTLESVLAEQGLTQAMLEEQISEQMKVEKLLDIKVTPEDIKKFYDDNRSRHFETVKARHILIKTEPGDSADQKAARKAKAEDLRKQAAAGGDFAKLARENSDCPSKENGGELQPPFRRGQMVPQFEECAFTLKPGEISPVIETDFGYHVIQVLERQTQPLAEVQARIGATLKKQQLDKKSDPLISKLKQQAKISYHHGAQPPPAMSLEPEEQEIAPSPDAAQPAPPKPAK